MTNPKIRVETRETEAAAWHARLGARSVSAQTIEEFFAWRSEPANADAYRRVEKIWGDTGRIADDPAIARALDEALSRKQGGARPGRLRRTLVGLAVGGAAVAAAAVGGALWLQSRTVFATDVGEQRLVQLADGSNVRLDTDSRIRVRFDGDRRLVELDAGQALFTVAHDAGRPFVVEADGARVTAVGTVFDVRRDRSGVKVILVSGAVDVAGRGGGETRRLAAGQQSRLTAKGQATGAADIQTMTSWTEGRIVFRDTPLRDAVSEVNRYLTDKIVLDPAVQETASVNGVFRTGDRDAFVSTASAVFGLQTSRDGEGRILLSRAKNLNGAPGAPGG